MCARRGASPVPAHEGHAPRAPARGRGEQRGVDVPLQRHEDLAEAAGCLIQRDPPVDAHHVDADIRASPPGARPCRRRSARSARRAFERARAPAAKTGSDAFGVVGEAQRSRPGVEELRGGCAGLDLRGEERAGHFGAPRRAAPTRHRDRRWISRPPGPGEAAPSTGRPRRGRTRGVEQACLRSPRTGLLPSPATRRPASPRAGSRAPRRSSGGEESRYRGWPTRRLHHRPATRDDRTSTPAMHRNDMSLKKIARRPLTAHRLQRDLDRSSPGVEAGLEHVGADPQFPVSGNERPACRMNQTGVHLGPVTSIGAEERRRIASPKYEWMRRIQWHPLTLESCFSVSPRTIQTRAWTSWSVSRSAHQPPPAPSSMTSCS